MAPNKKTGTRVPITYHIKRNKVNQKFPNTLSARPWPESLNLSGHKMVFLSIENNIIIYILSALLNKKSIKRFKNTER